MTIHDGVQLLCAVSVLGLVLLAHDRLRMNSSKVRLALGGTGILLATFGFFGIMSLLPRPWESGFSRYVDAIAIAICYLVGGLFVLSLIEVGGGTVQAIKRWRYYRRNGS